MQSIRVRLILLFIAVATSTLASFALYEQTILKRELEARFLALQNDIATRLQQTLAEPVWIMDQGVINAKLEAALIPLDVEAVYLFGPDRKEVIAGIARTLSGSHQFSRTPGGIKGIAMEVEIFPPAHVDEARRKTSLGQVVIHFSRARLDQALSDAMARHTVEVMIMNLLLLLVLLFSLRLVFVPLRGLRDALNNLASGEGAELRELPRINRVEFDEVIDGFNLTLRKLKVVISHHREAEVTAREATHATNEALAQVRVAQEELLEKNRQLETLTVTDSLTGLSNRLKLDRTLDDELKRNSRYASKFSLVLLDIDHFKLINDTHGHQVGDRVLVEIAHLLTKGTRSVDVLGRWGGEEFLVICPDTDLGGAMDVAEKLRLMIGTHAFPIVGKVTASFGVTAVAPGDSTHVTLARADNALYLAKEYGRNRVVSDDGHRPAQA